MVKKILFIFTVSAFYSAVVCADSQMFREFRTDEGQYNEYFSRGYDIQPNRPGVWDRGCRKDDYYCMALLERTSFQATIDRSEPNIMRDKALHPARY